MITRRRPATARCPPVRRRRRRASPHRTCAPGAAAAVVVGAADGEAEDRALPPVPADVHAEAEPEVAGAQEGDAVHDAAEGAADDRQAVVCAVVARWNAPTGRHHASASQGRPVSAPGPQHQTGRAAPRLRRQREDHRPEQEEPGKPMPSTCATPAGHQAVVRACRRRAIASRCRRCGPRRRRGCRRRAAARPLRDGGRGRHVERDDHDRREERIHGVPGGPVS